MSASNRKINAPRTTNEAVEESDNASLPKSASLNDMPLDGADAGASAGAGAG